MSEINVLDFVETLNAARAEADAAVKGKAEVVQELEAVNREVVELQKAVEQIPALQAQFDATQEALKQASVANSDIGSKYDEAVRQLETATEELAKVKDALASASDARDTAVKELADVKKELSLAKADVRKLETDVSKLGGVAEVAAQLKAALGAL